MKRKHDESENDDQSVANGHQETDNKHLEDAKRLTEMIRLKKKNSLITPKILINLNDLKYYDADNKWLMPHFYIKDIQNLVLYSLIGHLYKIVPRFCKILRTQYIKSVVLITINEYNINDYYKNEQQLFDDFNQIFKNHSTNEINLIKYENENFQDFSNEFIKLPFYYRKLEEDEVVESESIEIKANTDKQDKIDRTLLLLSIEQLIKEDYPIPKPFDSCTHSNSQYVPTKQKYKPVTSKSPLFAIDCEMCYDVDGDMEVVWLAIVDENLKCVYETLVKPLKKVQNYLTKITGITADSLKDVKVTIHDVRKRIGELLPEDAILCGQSLNNDLHALRLYHPYIIDTSIIYNFTGNRDIKPSLKFLTSHYLNKKIQTGTHNPRIDAKSSMELTLLKLRNGIRFGDRTVDSIINEKVEKDLHDVDNNIWNLLHHYNVESKFIDQNELPDSDDYKCDYLKANSNKTAFKELLKCLPKYKFSWCQFYANDSQTNEKTTDNNSKIKNILKYVNDIEKNVVDDSLMVVVFTGFNTNKDGLCFFKHKNAELFNTEKLINELYHKLNNK